MLFCGPEGKLSNLSTVPRLDVHRIEVNAGLRRLTCDAIKLAIMRQDNRAERSIRNHMAILDVLDARDAGLAEQLVPEHTLGLAAHVQSQGHLLETALTKPTE